MTKAALQRFDLRVKRMNFSFFNHLGSLSERTSNVRKSLDGSRPLTHGERQMEEGMGTAMCRTSNRNKNSDLLKNYPSLFIFIYIYIYIYRYKYILK